jgi:Tol biopolymer transport system component
VIRGSITVLAALALVTSASGSPSQRSEPTSDVYSIALDGTDLRKLTSTPDVSEDFVTPSPDGATLAFFQGRWLAIVRTDGQGLRRLAPFSPDDNFRSPPRWSPSGGEIAYAQGFSCTGALCYRQEVWVADVDTERRRRVAKDATAPAWSPSGRWVAYTRTRLVIEREPSYRLKVVVARKDGGRPRTIARGAADPAWSPGGRALAFAGHTGTGYIGLYRSRPDGSGRRRISRIFDPRDVSWSPNRRFLAFADSRRVYVIRPNGKGLRRVGFLVHPNSFSWSPDGRSLVWPRGKRLLIASTDGGVREIRVGVPTRVTSPVWSRDGTRIFFAGS